MLEEKGLFAKISSFTQRELMHIFRVVENSRMLYRYKLRTEDFVVIRDTLNRAAKLAPSGRCGQVLIILNNLIQRKWNPKDKIN
jgi:hypothetical protein